MRFTNEEILKNKLKQQNRKKVITTIIYIIIIPLIIYNISLIVQSVLIPNKTPSFFGTKTFVIVSGSMQPTLEIGDIILIKNVTEDEIQKNDIIAYREGQTVVTHRVIDIIETENGKQFITKGDNNNVKDSYPVQYRDIEGVYNNSKIVGIGNLVLFLQNKIVIICILIIFYLIYLHDNNKREKTRIRREKKEQFDFEYNRKIKLEELNKS